MSGACLIGYYFRNIYVVHMDCHPIRKSIVKMCTLIFFKSHERNNMGCTIYHISKLGLFAEKLAQLYIIEDLYKNRLDFFSKSLVNISYNSGV